MKYNDVPGFPTHARCNGCGCAPKYRAMVYAPLDEVKRRMMLPEGKFFSLELLTKLVEVKAPATSGVFVRLGLSYSCEACRPEFERAAAKGPSWCGIEFSRAVGPSTTLVHLIQDAQRHAS